MSKLERISLRFLLCILCSCVTAEMKVRGINIMKTEHLRNDACRIQNHKNRLVVLLLGAVCLVVISSSGCALRKDFIEISYEPATTVSKSTGADHVGVRVQVTDSRVIKDNVGR